MTLSSLKNTFLLLVIGVISCKAEINTAPNNNRTDPPLKTGAEQTERYVSKLLGKRVAIVANQTSQIYNGTVSYTEIKDAINSNTISLEAKNYVHLVDSLVSRNVNITKVFAPEHGFRGRADAGEKVKDDIDIKTGIPIVSLHGTHRKPTPEHLKNVDIIVFDIQDVGVRFYTYISTLSLVMEAAAEANIPVLILDRPNPNGGYIDGPTMLKEHTSFLGMHTIPLVHGMTIGEYGKMVNGEGWLAKGIRCELEIIPVFAYNKKQPIHIPTRPSPNLPNDKAIALYPTLGLLEGTNLNAGRGTEMQFQLIGSPYLPANIYTYTYTPKSNFGAKYPKHQNTVCNGLDLRQAVVANQIQIEWIIEAYNAHTNKAEFFNTKNFTAHAGTPLLQQQIEAGMSAQDIRASWQLEIEGFKKIRANYLIYPE